jgi:putative transcriptional regulator
LPLIARANVERKSILKKQRKPKKEPKVTVTFQEAGNTSARRYRGELPSVEVTAIRQRTGLSQRDFAASIGVPEGTLVNWEQDRRQPSGPAKVLLALLAKKPNLVAELYPAAPPKVRWVLGHPDPITMTVEERLAEVGRILASGILRMQTAHRDDCFHEE